MEILSLHPLIVLSHVVCDPVWSDLEIKIGNQSLDARIDASVSVAPSLDTKFPPSHVIVLQNLSSLNQAIFRRLTESNRFEINLDVLYTLQCIAYDAKLEHFL